MWCRVVHVLVESTDIDRLERAVSLHCVHNLVREECDHTQRSGGEGTTLKPQTGEVNNVDHPVTVAPVGGGYIRRQGKIRKNGEEAWMK